MGSPPHLPADISRRWQHLHVQVPCMWGQPLYSHLQGISQDRGCLAASYPTAGCPVPVLPEEIFHHHLRSKISSPEHPGPPFNPRTTATSASGYLHSPFHHTTPHCRCLLPCPLGQPLMASHCSPGMPVGAQAPCPRAEITGCQRNQGVPASLA